MCVPDKADFQVMLDKVLAEAQLAGHSYADVQSGELHRLVGGYPGSNHRMPTCCLVMRQIMLPEDMVLDQPPKGKGATLLIRYRLPR